MELLRGFELCASFGVFVFSLLLALGLCLGFGDLQGFRERARGGGGNGRVLRHF